MRAGRYHDPRSAEPCGTRANLVMLPSSTSNAETGAYPALWGNLLARASNARQPAVLNILCAVGGLGR